MPTRGLKVPTCREKIRRVKRVPSGVIWLVGSIVVAVGLGLLVHPHRDDDGGTLIGLGALCAGIVGVLAGAVLKRMSVALLLSVPVSLLYVIVYAFSVASHADDEDWTDESTGYLAALGWLPALFAMIIGTIVGGLIRKALRSWRGEAALIEELREDYAGGKAGEDVIPGGAPQ